MSQKLFIAVILLSVLFATIPGNAESASGTLTGQVTDNVGEVLQGAQITLDPNAGVYVTNRLGEFLVSDLPVGTYKVTVSYVGFTPVTNTVAIKSGQSARIDSKLQVASKNEVVVVYADRLHGEAEAINRTRTSVNILNVLPSEVIMSLPNANIADALGRLPGVTLERDEGEGKYVQIRGTDPSLSNTTIDGINVPSPEAGVNQIKLDTIPSDVVESVEINKTLSANQDGDAIGGSVNLVTKTAGENPTLSMYGLGGYTPILNGRGVSEFGITAGKRFLPNKRFGILGGFSWDYNGRGIDDIEPSPNTGTLAPTYDSLDIREYQYDRTRWAIAGGMDYKLSEGSGVYVRGLWSDFKDYGAKWTYTLNNDVTPGDTPSAPATFVGTKPKYSTSNRLPDYTISTLVVGGRHLFTDSWFMWNASIGWSRQTAAAGNPGATFAASKTIKAFAPDNCQFDPAATASVSKYRPQWQAACTAAASPVYDPSQWTLSEVDLTSGNTSQTNLQGQASYAKNYHAGGHFSTFELGIKERSQHKGQDAYSPTFDNIGADLPMSQFLSTFTNPNYYNKSYRLGPVTNWNSITSFAKANPNLFPLDVAATAQNSDASNFNLQQFITAGYVMNTIAFSKFNLQTGLRIEGTNLSTTGYQVTINPDGSYGCDQGFPPPCGTTPVNTKGSYVDFLPSAQLRYTISPNAVIRAVYGRGMSRPNPEYVIPSVTFDTSTNPNTYALGNAALKAEHANDYDLLYEQYLNPLGLIQAGFFYKQLSSPIVSITTFPTTGPYAGYEVTQPVNAGSAWVTGLEFAYQQHLSYLPGPLGALGISANYSWTASTAHDVSPLRSDSPALLRQAPNTWNLSPTYDKGPLSIRMGLSYNGANIYQYQYQNLQYACDTCTNTVPLSPQPVAGTKGPSGDNYLYAHLQIDAQGSYRLPKGFSVYASGLNLSNEVFGFYNGSPQYVVQREYYSPTFSGGLRWTSHHE